jgi:hypothetical protein
MSAENDYMEASMKMNAAIQEYVVAAGAMEKDHYEIADDIVDAMTDAGITVHDISVE